MQRIRSGKDTKPEILLRRRLFALGYRYRCNVRLTPRQARHSVAKV
ncbi:MAG: hypothetical protein R3F46_01375 [bacterium]